MPPRVGDSGTEDEVRACHSRQMPRSLRRIKATSRSVSGVGMSVSIFARASSSFRPERSLLMATERFDDWLGARVTEEIGASWEGTLSARLVTWSS